MSAVQSRLFTGTRVLLEAAKAAAKHSSSASASAKKASSTARLKSTTAAARPSKPKASVDRTSGIFKQVPVSPELRSFLGISETSRPDAVKKIWDYIKLNNLQNPANKKEIRCDEKLKPLFEGKEKFGFADVGKMLSRHLVKTA